MKPVVRAGALLVSVLTAGPALAQNWSFDARNIAMGGVGSTSNVAVDMVDEQRPYRPLVLPFGLLFQVLPNLPKLNPSSDDFDLIRTIEYAASPIHYILGRDSTATADVFITDLTNGELNRDLNVYRGFSPATSTFAEGLASPNWGYTFKVKKSDDGAFQGIYVGAGPYFSMKTDAEIDPALAAIFASPTPVYVPNTSFFMSNDTVGQFAIAITGGYRGRFALPGGARTTSGGPYQALQGLYVGANYHFLRGVGYQNFEADARLDTNAQGLLFVNLTKGAPVTLVRRSASDGTGFAIDMGVAAVVNRWEAGFGVNGIGNRIDWTGVERTNYVLDSLFAGGEFVDGPTVPVGDERVELPVDVRANGAYNADHWTGLTEFGHGYNGTSFRAGFEERIDRYQLRAGSRYIKERWEVTGGAGVNLTPHFGIDVGLFSTSANLERQRHLAIGVSLRFVHGPKAATGPKGAPTARPAAPPPVPSPGL
jgi:hypothetical protein